MRIILILVCGFLTSFTAHSQSIYDNANSVNPGQSETCYASGVNPKTTLDKVLDNWYAQYETEPCSASNLMCRYITNKTFDKFDSETNCGGKATVNYTQRRYNATNGEYYDIQENYSYQTYHGYSVLSTQCPPDSPQGSTNYLYTSPLYTDGKVSACYNPQQLADLDSCPDSFSDQSSIIPSDGNTQQSICTSKPDGSKCSYSLSDDGTYYQTTFENEHCYDSYPVTEIEIPDPDETTCIGDFCPADPALHCDASGRCDESCGYINDAFYCSKGQIKDGDPWQAPEPPPCETDCDDIEDPIEEPPTEECNPETEECPTNPGTGGQTPNVDLTPIIDLMTYNPTRDKLTGNTQLKNQAEQQLDEVEQQVKDEFGKSAEEAGLNLLEGSDVQYIETLFGTFPQSSCQNPVFMKATLDWCSRAPTINEWLYWIFAVMTVIACVHQVVDIVRR